LVRASRQHRSIYPLSWCCRWPSAVHDRETEGMGFQRAQLGPRRRTSWKTRVVVAVLAADAGVAVAGLWVVPAVLRAPGGLAAMLGVVAAQSAIAVVAVIGPAQLGKRSRTAGISLAVGALFAAAYVGLLAAELAGAQLSFDRGAVTVYALFAAAGMLAGAMAYRRTTRLTDGSVAGCWAQARAACRRACTRKVQAACRPGAPSRRAPPIPGLLHEGAGPNPAVVTAMRITLDHSPFRMPRMADMGAVRGAWILGSLSAESALRNDGHECRSDLA
jgi:hypothetical protein